MTLLDAQTYDEARARRRRNAVIASIIAAFVIAAVLYHMRDYPERHKVDKFFAQIEEKNYEQAYSIWFNDPDWKQNEARHSAYPFKDFYRDWGPGGEWGLVKSYSVDCSYSPKKGSGVIVQVTVNNRAEHAYVWAEKSAKTLSFSPNEIDCGNWFGWLVE